LFIYFFSSGLVTPKLFDVLGVEDWITVTSGDLGQRWLTQNSWEKGEGEGEEEDSMCYKHWKTVEFN
jgi:hypothetical protein